MPSLQVSMQLQHAKGLKINFKYIEDKKFFEKNIVSILKVYHTKIS